MQAGELFGDIPVISYEWEHLGHDSASVKIEHDRVVARNLVKNPSFGAGRVGNLGSAVYVTPSIEDGDAAVGRYATRISTGSDSPAGFQLVSWEFDIPAGTTHLAGRIFSKHLAGSDHVGVRLVYSDGGLHYSTAGWHQAGSSWGRSEPVVFEIPDHVTVGRVYLYLASNDSYGAPAPHSAILVDGLQVAAGNSVDAAVSQLEEYFDGSTPNVTRSQDDTSRQYVSRVVVNGFLRDVKTWSIDPELTGDLPQQVAAVNGVMQTTGKIEWSASEDVSDGGRNPWNPSTGWVPSHGDRVEIYVSDGVTEWRQFTGMIDRTTGSAKGGFTSTIVDEIDRLSTDVSHEPLVAIMPPVEFDGSENYRYVGLHPLYFIDYALRQAGFYTTPPQESIANLFAPLQGSLWPHKGRLRSQPEISQGYNTVAPWGLGRRGFVATYDPTNGYPMSEPTQLTIMVAPDHDGATDFFVDYGSRAHHLRLHITPTRQAVAYKNATEICRLTLGSATVVNMMAKNGQISLRTDTGDESSGAFNTSGAGMSAIVVNASSNASVAGLQVSHPRGANQEHQPTRFTPTARFNASSLRLAGLIDASPNIENRKVYNLLKEINDALLGVMWLDEHGIMQWTMSDTLRNSPPVRTITTLDDVLDLDWETGLLQSASRVTVTWRSPSISVSRWRNIILAEGSGGTMKAGDQLEVFLEASAGEEWIMPSFHFLEIGGTVQAWGSYNYPAYSAVGMHFTDGDGDEVTGLDAEITTHRLGHQKAMIRHVAGSWPSDVEGTLKTSPSHVALWPKNRNQPLPRISGMGRVEWVEDRLTLEGPGGRGPELVHDIGYWANRHTEIIERIAQYIAEQATVPQPVIHNLEIVPDPRLQLGDVINVHSNNYLGVRLRVLIVGKNLTFVQGALSMSLSVRVLDATTTFTTYEDFQQQLSHAELTYTQWQALAPTTQTYTDFNAAPRS